MAPPKPKGKRSRLTGAPLKQEVGNAHAVCVSVAVPTETHITHSSSTIYLDTLPAEVFNNILARLEYPRSRLPGLTEHQSGLPRAAKIAIKATEDLTAPPDSERFGANLFDWVKLRHPFNTLAATSRRCRALVESFCAHLVKVNNRFNLPFDLVEKHGIRSIYPDLSNIVYRRLWLQTAPRSCVFCGVHELSRYPHRRVAGLLLTCEDCFYAQMLDLAEIQEQYHIEAQTLIDRNVRCSGPRLEWILRMDVEALAVELYGTRAFHSINPYVTKRQCRICNGLQAATRVNSSPWAQRMPPHLNSSRRASRRIR